MAVVTDATPEQVVAFLTGGQAVTKEPTWQDRVVTTSLEMQVKELRAEVEWLKRALQEPNADNELLRAALRGLLDEVMCFSVDPPSAALNHAIEEAGRALEHKP